MAKEPEGDPRDAESIPMSGFEVLGPEEKGGLPAHNINVTQTFITAQIVPNPRRVPAVVAKIREIAVVGGERFYYSWEVKDRKTGKMQEIAGLSVKGANALAVIYGNCSVDATARETDTHYYIKATFIDLETGFNFSREFRQRKGQNLGKMDRDRAEDIAFQIGQSKAMRNVVTNALDVFANEMFNYARKGVMDRIQKNPTGALAWIKEMAEKHGVTQKQMELYVVRPMAEWAAPQMAKLFGALGAVDEGMETASNVFAEGSMPEVQTSDSLEGGKPADQGKATTSETKKEPPKSNRAPKDKPADQKPKEDAKAPPPEKKEEPKAEAPKEEPKTENKPGVTDQTLMDLSGEGWDDAELDQGSGGS